MQKSIKTWLNMADCVRRMARWKSFCGTRCVTARAREAPEPRALPTAGVSRIHVCVVSGEGRPLSPPRGWGVGAEGTGRRPQPELYLAL